MDKIIWIRTCSFCVICQDEIKNPAALSTCFHQFCLSCVKNWFKEHNVCPVCRRVCHTILYHYKGTSDCEYRMQHNRHNFRINPLVDIGYNVALGIRESSINLCLDDHVGLCHFPQEGNNRQENILLPLRNNMPPPPIPPLRRRLRPNVNRMEAGVNTVAGVGVNGAGVRVDINGNADVGVNGGAGGDVNGASDAGINSGTASGITNEVAIGIKNEAATGIKNEVTTGINKGGGANIYRRVGVGSGVCGCCIDGAAVMEQTNTRGLLGRRQNIEPLPENASFISKKIKRHDDN